jgi:hypothetical protein
LRRAWSGFISYLNIIWFKTESLKGPKGVTALGLGFSQMELPSHTWLTI